MSSYSAILIPLDGSGFAESALPAAMSLARRSKAAIHLVRVHSQLPLWDVGAEVVVLSPEMEKETLEYEETYLEQAAGRVRAAGFEVFSSVLKGEIVPAIRDYCRDHAIDLVVITTHGRGGVRRAMLGSVADHLMRTSSVPVLMITTRSAPRITTAWPSRILVPLDGSPHSAASLKQVRALDPDRTARILLTAIVQTIPPTINPWVFPPEFFLETAEHRSLHSRDYLNRTVTELRSEGFRVGGRIELGTKVAREILKVALSKRCDLIVMTTHGAGGMDRVMFGSVADQVIRHSTTPVLVVRPQAVQPVTQTGPARELAQAGA